MNTTQLPAPAIPVLNAAQTAAALPYKLLVELLLQAANEKSQGLITAPPRQALPYPRTGVLLSMPATAEDIGVHKLVNVIADNAERGLPIIQGLVSVYDGHTGTPLFVLDGPTVTKIRTAAVSMMGLKQLWPQPKHAAIIGAGTQAEGHLEALQALYPDCQLSVVARHFERAQQKLGAHFERGVRLEQQVPDTADVVITTTNSLTPVYHEPPQAQRLLIAVGAFTPDMAELPPETVRNSKIYVDDIDGAKEEAGDLLQAQIAWEKVTSIEVAEAGQTSSTPLLYKTVGCAAWDLAAARCARQLLPQSEP